MSNITRICVLCGATCSSWQLQKLGCSFVLSILWEIWGEEAKDSRALGWVANLHLGTATYKNASNLFRKNVGWVIEELFCLWTETILFWFLAKILWRSCALTPSSSPPKTKSVSCKCKLRHGYLLLYSFTLGFCVEQLGAPSGKGQISRETAMEVLKRLVIGFCGASTFYLNTFRGRSDSQKV